MIWEDHSFHQNRGNEGTMCGFFFLEASRCRPFHHEVRAHVNVCLLSSAEYNPTRIARLRFCLCIGLCSSRQIEPSLRIDHDILATQDLKILVGNHVSKGADGRFATIRTHDVKEQIFQSVTPSFPYFSVAARLIFSNSSPTFAVHNPSRILQNSE